MFKLYAGINHTEVSVTVKGFITLKYIQFWRLNMNKGYSGVIF